MLTKAQIDKIAQMQRRGDFAVACTCKPGGPTTPFSVRNSVDGAKSRGGMVAYACCARMALRPYREALHIVEDVQVSDLTGSITGLRWSDSRYVRTVTTVKPVRENYRGRAVAK